MVVCVSNGCAYAKGVGEVLGMVRVEERRRAVFGIGVEEEVFFGDNVDPIIRSLAKGPFSFGRCFRRKENVRVHTLSVL
ncbi:hypothetical protein CEXT_467351 [Caerostris extrusa]|uniref:Uncharacterized protein n=1 Tax=Caerostris extrusa TaxID=172846 RepID=A0AAV4UWW5_CAEEX|nr:hypothetical protein CEXT_467351 [Caerostris extrusa]